VQKSKYPVSSVFKVPNLTSAQASQLYSPLMAYGILTKFSSLSKGDIVLITNQISTIGQSIEILSSHYGYKLLKTSIEEISTKEGLSKLKSNGNIKLAVAPNDSKAVRYLYKALSTDGNLVLFNNHIEKITESDGLHLSVSHSVFDNVAISGLNLQTWAKEEPDNFQDAINVVANLIQSKDIPTVVPSSVFTFTKFMSALSEVKEGRRSIITF
jgi:NADPH:quinone reductase-like Zn-dependent oxidoreductase